VLLGGLAVGVASPAVGEIAQCAAIAVAGGLLLLARREGALVAALVVAGWLRGLEAQDAVRYRAPEALGLPSRAEPFGNDANLTVLLQVDQCGGAPGEERFSARLLGLAQPDGWHRLRDPIEVRGRAAVKPGASYLARGRFRREQAPLPIDRSPRFLFAPSRLFAVAAVDSAPAHAPSGTPLGRRGIDRYRWAARLEERLGPEAGALAEWALLDVRPSVAGSSWSEPFRRTGTSHLLSISGIHLVLIGGMFFLATKVLTRGSPLSLPISVGALVGYTWMVGAPPAAMRAAWMAVFALVGPRAGRLTRSWNLLGLAALLLGASDPALLLAPPLVLSLFAMAGVFLGSDLWLAFFGRPRRRDSALWRGIEGALHAVGALLAVSFAAVLLTAPWSFYFFGSFYWGGLFANLLAVPAMGIALPCIFVAALAVLAGCGASHPWVVAGRWAGESMLALIRAMAGPSSGTLVAGAVDRAHAFSGSLLLGLCLWLVIRARQQRRWRQLAPWALLLAAPTLAGITLRCSTAEGREAPRLQLDVLTVGQGDAILIRAGRTRWLFDAGPGGPFDPLVAHLLARGCRRLERVYVSHGDLDHWGGLERLLASGVEVDTLVLPERGRFPESFTAMLRAAPRHPVVLRAAAGWERALGAGLRARIVHPIPGREPLSDNNGSLGLLLEAERITPVAPDDSLRGQRFRVLLIADLERPGEEELLRYGLPAPISVLQAGHHGSRTSSSEAWLDRLRPRLAFASLAEGNRFGFPHPELTARYAARGIPLISTDREGALRFELRGDRVEIARESTRRAVR